MTEKDQQELLATAQSVLQNNWVELENGTGFSKPATRVYPYQWNWDSGFTAIGYSHFNIERAKQELRSLFSGQWKNGMVPHIIFHTESLDYFPDQSFWQANKRNSSAPEKPQTSGMTQPPVQAIATWRIYQKMREGSQEAEEWLREMYSKLYKQHEYFYTKRDRNKNGIITIYHPWESGMDNSPRWDDILDKIEINTKNKYQRQDTRFVDKRFRPSDASYNEYIFLAEKMKQANYEDELLKETHPFAVEDVLLSSILHLATGYLEKIAMVLGENTVEIKQWLERLPANIFRNQGEDRLFYDKDLRKDQLINVKTAACLAPIIAGVTTASQTEEIFDTLDKSGFCGEKTCHTSLLPSVGAKEDEFSPEAYWRGPIWININWLVWLGLKAAGHDEHANILRHNLLTLLREHGIWEYYSPEDLSGIGANRFTWSAALAIDILASE